MLERTESRAVFTLTETIGMSSHGPRRREKQANRRNCSPAGKRAMTGSSRTFTAFQVLLLPPGRPGYGKAGGRSLPDLKPNLPEIVLFVKNGGCASKIPQGRKTTEFRSEASSHLWFPYISIGNYCARRLHLARFFIFQ
jgi:hypothetical protein